MCGKLPATLARFAVLGPLHPHTITCKPFLPSFLSRSHSREKRYQALSRFTVLIAMESWAGPGNEASVKECKCMTIQHQPSFINLISLFSLLCLRILCFLPRAGSLVLVYMYMYKNDSRAIPPIIQHCSFPVVILKF